MLRIIVYSIAGAIIGIILVVVIATAEGRWISISVSPLVDMTIMFILFLLPAFLGGFIGAKLNKREREKTPDN